MKITFIKGRSLRYRWYPEFYISHPYLGYGRYAKHAYLLGIRLRGKVYSVVISTKKKT